MVGACNLREANVNSRHARGFNCGDDDEQVTVAGVNAINSQLINYATRTVCKMFEIGTSKI